MEILKTLPTSSWQEAFSEVTQTENTNALEDGHVLFFPKLSFDLTEKELTVLLPDYVNSKSKNISYNKTTGEIRGLAKAISLKNINSGSGTSSETLPAKILQSLLARFAGQAHQFINALFPSYRDKLIIGRTSFRPVEIDGRVSSYRKDDTRLHVDAFPANPNHGMRILRVFSNINPEGKARVWRLGEPFEQVAKQFLSKLKTPIPGSATLLHLLKITKKRRTLYDHYMLQLHDAMKGDVNYQRNAKQQEIHFPTQTTWVVQTDHVSHAAMSGQHLLEQTFYLPVNAMQDSHKSPLRTLEKLINKPLI